jgi:lysophospholipase L1-like esterase
MPGYGRLPIIYRHSRTTIWLSVLLAAVFSPAGLALQYPQRPPFEAEIEAFEASDRLNPPPTGAVLFIGSSSIRLWKSLAQDFPELTVMNRGFGGSAIADSVRYADRIVIPYKPRMIVLYAGGNDIHKGDLPEKVLKDFESFVAAVHSALPKTRIVYISINPSVARWAEEDRVLATNRLIAEYIRNNRRKTPDLAFINSHSKLLGHDGGPRPELLRADGLHLNDRGYALWLKILKPDILRLARGAGFEEKRRKR